MVVLDLVVTGRDTILLNTAFTISVWFTICVMQIHYILEIFQVNKHESDILHIV